MDLLMSDDQIDLLDWLEAHPPDAPDTMPSAYEGATGTESMAPVLLTRADPASNMHRFYGLEFATSLFGECGVVRHWGRIGTSGRRRTDWFNEPQEAEAAFLVLLRAKRRRGYAP
jgi:Uncharacterized conserved protein